MDPSKPLTQQQLHAYINLLKKMKSEGKDLNDPQYKNLHQFLKAQMSNHNILKQQNQQVVNTVIPNPVQPPLTSATVQQFQQAPQSSQVPTPLFTQQQKERLKAQIFAFKHHISKREPLPPSLQQAVMGINVENNLKEYETTYLNPSGKTAPQVPSTQPQPNNVVVQQQQQQLPVSQPPRVLPSTVAANASFNATVTNQPTIPAMNNQASMGTKVIDSKINPDTANQRQQGLDLQTLYREREKRIQHKMKRKFEHLKSSLNTLPPSEQLRSVIEIKQFQLLKQQKELRADIIRQLKTQAATPIVDTHVARASQMVTDQSLTTKKSKTQKTKEKTTVKSKKFFTDLTNARKRIKEYYKNDVKKPVEKINKDLVTFFEKKAKQEKEKKARAEKARLKALKENDEEAYFKLLEQTKEGRLTELLKQTDECLKSLGASLVSGRDGEQEPELEFDQEEEGEKNIFKKFLLNQNNYYKVAHKLVEKVEKQPSILVGGGLKAYQLQGLQWLVSLYNNKINGILADEMGLGKTIQTISLLSYLYEFKNNKGPHLVIVPLSTIDNWALEFEKWCPTLKLVRYGGDKNQRKHVQNTYLKTRDFQVLLTQYEYITREKSILKKIPWNYIIMDEGHRIKNSDCKLVKALVEYNSKYRVLLTGTPLQNDLKELWALLNFLLPKIFDSSVNFENWFNSPFGGDKAEMTEEEKLLIIHRLHQVLRPFLLRREKTDVEEQLPEKSEKIIYIDLSAMQKKMYTDIQDKNKLNVNGKRLKMQSLSNTVMQLRKVCNHPFLFFTGSEELNALSDEKYYEMMTKCSGKFELLDRILPKFKKTGHRVLLFSQMTSVLDLMEEFLTQKNYQYLRLDGAVKASERGDLVKKWNEKDSQYFIFLLSTRSGGLGLNLQTADTVIMFDSDWNPQQDLQAMARAHRIGQTKSVLVLTFVTRTPVEEKIRERAQAKRDAEAKVIKAGKFNQKSTIMERNEMLETLLKKASDFESVHEAPNDEQLNNMLARNDDEFEIFQNMDKEREQEVLKQHGRITSRLMTEEELPEWIKDKEVEEGEAEEAEYGRGRRSRADINYEGGSGDEMEDEEEDNAAPEEEEEEDQAEEEEEEGTKKRKRRSAKKEESSKKKKTTAKSNGKKKKVQEEEEEEEDGENNEVDSEDITIGYSYDNTPYQQVYDSLGSSLQQQLYSIFMEIATKLDEEDGRALALPFLELPDRKDFPDYYDLIQTPICLNDIDKKIRNGVYKRVEDMEQDIQTLVVNAQTYNQEGSAIYQDAETIRQIFLSRKSGVQ
ncbi:hypothetical protein FDP41_008182 [Naegleria fowleri]|uniref:Uncharacterized protein n=1 Tax=Naegleria fowleri TaxID=5763 RepID=A0A6A5BHG9_NAEFO|nr:uncharacterized protein FDP41_008182 [Naegleria fowleri]KAF0973478.1 hypothetical protein FDP41_008182 [Naegleria fowleri]CAG4713785.1 unnamed protein product [Naegleria fowleri]